MMRTTLSLFVAAIAAAAVPATGLSAQDMPGVRLQLQSRAIVPANDTIELTLVVDVDETVAVPAVVLNGYDLAVRVGGADKGQLASEGNGDAVRLEAGTRVIRPLRLPLADVLGAEPPDEMQRVSLSWRDQPGVECSFKVAPSTEGISVEQLDLEKTEVVLATNYGEIRLTFRPDKAPNHVANFVKLCLQGFYDGTKFHRVMRNFMIQGGDPLTRDESKKSLWGTGGPGYTLDAEFSDLRHLRGTLSTARKPGDPDSGGSGFFIVHKDASHLDGQYSAFGNVVEGIDTLDAIANVPVGGSTGTMPMEPVVLESAIVLPVKK